MSTLNPARRPPNNRTIDFIIDLETTVAHRLSRGHRSSGLTTSGPASTSRCDSASSPASTCRTSSTEYPPDKPRDERTETEHFTVFDYEELAARDKANLGCVGLVSERVV
jgi:hypothetical protein